MTTLFNATSAIHRASSFPTAPAACTRLALILTVGAFVGSDLAVNAFAANAPAAATPGGKAADVENSVVRIYSTSRRPELLKPWTKQAPRVSGGTGIVIEGKRILTNAHVVSYTSQIEVQPNQSGQKIAATVEAIAPGIDLAVLKLDDESFFDTHPPLARASELPQIKDTVLVYGYPTGGSNLSITKGIVSRIEFTRYEYSVSGLRIQIDAAINPGNSGGPALVGDKVIGLAFSHLSNAQNIGYIIPSEEIELFLRDVADGRHDGKPSLYDEHYTLENTALRAFLKLDASVQGVVVREPYDTAASPRLEKWDVIRKIGDTPVDNEGRVNLGGGLRVRFGYLVQKLAVKGKVPISVVRGGKEITFDAPLLNERPKLIPFLNGTFPSYFIYGPIVFSKATEDLLTLFAGSSTQPVIASAAGLSQRGSPLALRRNDKPAFPGEELVVVPSPFFPHRTAKGYDNPMARVVQAINGTPVKNLLHLVELLRDAKDDFVVIEFAGRAAESVVLPRKECISATEEILSDNGVRAQGTPDTLAMWNTKPRT